MGLGAHGLTRKQEALVEAALTPGVLTVTEAGKLAGYPQREGASRALRTVTVQRELVRRRAERRDSASAIQALAQSKLAGQLATETQDTRDLALVVKLMADVRAALPDEDHDTDRVSGIQRVTGLILRAFTAGYSQALRGRISPIVKDLVPQGVINDNGSTDPEVLCSSSQEGGECEDPVPLTPATPGRPQA
jgi:hypothetical protein